MNKDLLKRFGKPALGLGLLLLLVSQLDTKQLGRVLADISLPWFIAAVLLATAANLTCAFRWQKIVAMFGRQMSGSEALRLYFQGVTANTVLPGGIVGGDIWRTVALVRKGETKINAARTVLLDRVSGFWGLALLSLAALGVAWWGGEIAAGSHGALVGIYALALGAVGLAPLAGFLIRLSRESVAILKTIPFSAAAQLLTMIAFWCCLSAVGVGTNLAMLASVCAGIFLGAVVPASIGGFGSREVAAVFFLAAIGVSPEPAFVASFLFGLTATIQGLLFFLLVLKGHQPKA